MNKEKKCVESTTRNLPKVVNHAQADFTSLMYYISVLRQINVI